MRKRKERKRKLMEMEKIVAFNKDQAQHIRLVQQFCWDFVKDLMAEVVVHDWSKWESEEYETFVDSRNKLKASQNGKDEEYQKTLAFEAIKHHYKYNSHHPEYWYARGESMPLHEIVIMFFDWLSRSYAKRESMAGFWDYNIEKLEVTNQSHAIAVVKMLRAKYEKPYLSPVLSKDLGGKFERKELRVELRNPEDGK